MWFDLPMEQKRTHDNDDEPLTFTQLGLPTALIINRMRNAETLRELANSDEKKENRERDSNPGKTDEQRAEDERRYIDHRLKEIAAWERKISGRKV